MTDGLTITNLTQQVQSLIDRSKQQADSLSAWLGGSANGGPNNDGRYPLKDLAGRETLVPSPAMFNDMVSGPAAQADVAKVSAELARDDAIHAASRSDAQRILSEAARGAAVDARNLAQEHRNHAGTHEANARYWAELAQGSGQGSADDRAVVEQLASETADNAALAAQDAQDAAASAALAATFDPALFDRKADLLSADRITGVLPVDRIPVLPSQRQFASSGGLANLTTAQQAEIGQGSIVTTTDGFRYVYSGEGSKTLATSYVVLADTTPEWSSISGKPSTFTPAAHTQDWSTISGKPALMIAGDTVTIPHGSYGSGGFFLGNGDAASYTTHNFIMKGWWGMGLADYNGVVRGFYDFRAGRWDTKGGYRVDGRDVFHPGNLTPLDLNNGGVVKGLTQFKNNGNPTVASSGLRNLEVLSEDGGSAVMSFHRAGQQAVYFGLDIDNELKVGSWSYGPSSYRLWTAKNFNPHTKMDNLHSAWIGSSEGAARFFFGVNGRTYIRGEGVELRTKGDQTIAWFEDNKNVQIYGNVYINDNWLRIRGNTGVVWENHGGGWQMTDSTWLRSFNNKHVYTAGQMRADSGFYIGDARQPIFTISQAAPSGGADGDVHIVW